MASYESSVFRSVLIAQKIRATHRLPVAAQRAELERVSQYARIPGRARIVSTQIGSMAAEWVGEPRALRGRVLLYLHGGGYFMGSPSTHRPLVARLALGMNVLALAPDYRLAPEHPFPAALDDALAAYRWLRSAGFAAERIAIAGDSAGGGLALATLLRLRDAGEALPAAALLCSPWVDLAAEGESIRTRAAFDPWLTAEAIHLSRHYCGGHDPHHPLISPVYADLRGLPPLFIQVGADEILLSDSTRLAARAQDAGVAVRLDVWERMWHVWHLFAPLLPEANQAISEGAAFLAERLAEQP
ncbi:MAG: alpha/beta hydrolase [Roseiflexaceae bacterium]